MSQRTNLNTPQHDQSLDGSEFMRSPDKNKSLISQMFLDPTDALKDQFLRKPSTQKHKTFNGVGSTCNLNRKTYEPQKYHLATIAQKKIFITLALVERFIQQYEQQKVIYDQKNKKMHQDRKKAFLHNSSSQFRAIEPISHEHLNQGESYEFLVSFRNQLKSFFRQNFIAEIKKRRDKLSLIYKEEKLESIQQTEKQNVRQSSFKNLQPPSFITDNFNSTSMSNSFPQVDFMALSSFPPNVTKLIKNNQTDIKPITKFNHLKLTQSKSRLRIRPAKNKYQSRKKEEIRLFMQLDQKTQHLQNFRSEEGKFFKFNQNLKVTIKSINLCRIVLLGKKSAIMQQFERLGDDNFFRVINEKIITLEKTFSNKESRKNSKHKDKSIKCPSKPHEINIKTPDLSYELYPLQEAAQSVEASRHVRKNSADCEPLHAYKQKALRIKHYIEEMTKLFAEIQSFLVEFLKDDKGYENYKKQNALKQRISGCQQIPEQEKFYRDFVDKCFHLSQISRLYFNALNHFAHQNINLKELKLINKNLLEQQNKRLIQLRYALIYMQKECQNTAQSTFFNITFVQNMFSKMNQTTTDGRFISPLYSDKINGHSSQSNMTNFIKNKQITQNTVKKVLKQTQNIIQVPTSPQKQLALKSSSSMQIKSVANLNPFHDLINRKNSADLTGIKRSSRQRQQRVSTNTVKEEEPDINVIWKTFYDKKFSSKAIRIRLY